jgi:hypothetical protein
MGVVLELYRQSLSEHAALARFGGRMAAYLLWAAVALGLLGILLDKGVPAGQSVILHRFFTFERTMEFVIAFLILAITAFVGWFPVRMNRNLVIYIAGFVGLFLSRSSALLFINLMPPSAALKLNVVMLCVSFGCLLLWLIAMRKEGEFVLTIPGHRWNLDAISALTGQLESINAALAKFCKY